MSIREFTVLVWLGSFAAGLLGALTGVGGGVVLVSLLTLLSKVDMRYAIGASFVSVIATSSGAAAAYVKEGFSNIRIGMFLEIATTLGALLGAFLAARVRTNVIAIIFGLVLIDSAYLSRRPRTSAERDDPPDALATKYRLNGSFPEGTTTSSRYWPDSVSCLRPVLCPDARYRLGRNESPGDGPGHENSFQGFNRNQQLHDRRHAAASAGLEAAKTGRASMVSALLIAAVADNLTDSEAFTCIKKQNVLSRRKRSLES